MFFLTVFGTRAKFFQNFDDKLSVRLSNLLFSCPGEEVERKKLFYRKSIFFIFLTLVKKTSDFWQENFSRVLITDCQKFSRKVYLFSSVSRHWPKFSGIFDENFSAELSQLRFTSSGERFHDYFLEKWSFFHHFRTLSEKKSNFWREYHDKLVKFQVKTICGNNIHEKE